jgi:hypothetical protein
LECASLLALCREQRGPQSAGDPAHSKDGCPERQTALFTVKFDAPRFWGKALAILVVTEDIAAFVAASGDVATTNQDLNP